MSCEELCTRGEAVYIYTLLRGQVCARVIATPSHNNAPGQCRDSNSIIKLSFFFNFIIKFTFTNLSFLKAENWLSFKIIILLVYILIILNRVPIVIIRKYKLNIKVVINSFSL